MHRALSFWPIMAGGVISLLWMRGDLAAVETGDMVTSRSVVTNVSQISDLSSEDPTNSYVFNLEGIVLWFSPAQGRLVIQDDSGAEQLEMNLTDQSFRAGDRVRLEGTGTIVKTGGLFRIGNTGPVVNNDGVHGRTEKSGSIFLAAGWYSFQLDWFNGTGRSGLEVEYETSGLARQKIPDIALTRMVVDPATGNSNRVSGIDFRSYEGQWDALPDFSQLTPIKSGTVANFNLSGRTRDGFVGMQFTGLIEAPREGSYTFHLTSDDGGRLFIRQPAMRVTKIGQGEFPAPTQITIGQQFSSSSQSWVQVEGKVTFARKQREGLQVELQSADGRMQLEIADATAVSPAQLLNRRIRATGFCQSTFTPSGRLVAGLLLVPGGKQIEIIEPFFSQKTGEDTGSAIQPLPVLTTADQIRGLKRPEARLGYPVRIQGVVTSVQADNEAFVVHDSTFGLFVKDASGRHFDLPRVGEFVEIEGKTEDPGIATAQLIRRLGIGNLPEPAHPNWDQLLNGSLDSQWVEIGGLVDSITHRSNGWSRVMLRTRSGVLKVDLRRAGIQPSPVDQYENAAVRLRGCMFADWMPDLRLKVGQIRMYDVDIVVDQPAPADPFSIPTITTASLLRFDPAFEAARQVKVAGQIIYVRELDHFMMDGTNGLRFQAKRPLNLEVGDLVEAVGFPELSGAAPVLRGASARKTGHSTLPEPKLLSSRDLVNPANDSTLVKAQGELTSLRQTKTNQVLEIQTGTPRFFARLNGDNEQLKSLRLGSLLELTGAYCAQGGYSALGTDFIPLDLLVNSPSDIRVLSQPSWWTFQRLLALVGLLAGTLATMVLWITQLHRKVEQRTAELGAQIQERQQIENQRAMEQERTRIAQDLHVELGSDIATISMLAARAQFASASDTKRGEHLDQVRGKAREMVAALDEIVWAMNPGHDSLASLASYFRRYADRFLSLANIACRFEGSSGKMDRPLDSQQRHQLFLAFKEALMNVVRHSGATEVRVNLDIEGNELRLTVTDNGRGLPAGERTGEMNGVANMRTRIEKLHGHFEIASEPGRGTTVRLSMPLT